MIDNRVFFQNARKKLDEATTGYEQLIGEVRGPVASVAIVENVKVEYYGEVVSLKEVASFFLPEPMTISIEPWDKSLVGEIQKALIKAEVSGTITVDPNGKILVKLPPMTGEDREKMIKELYRRLENGRNAIRAIRNDLLSDIKNMQKEKVAGEDELKRWSKNIEELIKEYQTKIEILTKRKEDQLKV